MTGQVPRTLPIRTPAYPGEALDSWLEALASRLQASLADLVDALTPTARHATAGRPPRRSPADWTISLRDGEAFAIAAACQLGTPAVTALTLARYDGVGLRINHQTGKVDRNVLWGRTKGSRFCPACLAETGGRWRLSWRLGWSFACPTHHCLLADTCPACERMQRRTPHPQGQIPRPGTCANAAPRASGARPLRCGADLAATQTPAFPPDHPVLHAQRIVWGVIDSGTAGFGVYAASPQPAPAALADLRVLAEKILAGSPPGELGTVLPADIAAEYARVRALPHSRRNPAAPTTRPGFLAPARAAVAAAGLTAAVHALGLPDPHQAGAALRRLFRAEDADAWRAVHVSPVLHTVRLAALGHLPEPAGPPAPPGGQGAVPAAATRTRQTPTLFWPAWAVRLLPPLPGTSPQTRQRCLAAVFLTATTGMDLTRAAHGLGGAIDPRDAAPLHLRLQRDPRWPAALAALGRLARHLDEHPAPVDYGRRRRLAYHDLLPDPAWEQICRRVGVLPGQAGRARTARRWVFERISGMPADLAPPAFAVGSPHTRAELAAFTARLTPDLAAALDEHARQFLDHHGVHAEPVCWRPPLSLLDGLDLPGPDPTGYPPADVHRLVRGERLPARAAAARLGTTIDVIRCILDEYPAPPDPLAPGHTATAALRARLPKDELAALHHDQQLSLHTLAPRFGVSRQVLARLLDEYDIPVAAHRRRIPIDRDWLHEQYATNRRTLADLADELGISRAYLTRRARALGIPLRGRGTPSHARTLRPGRPGLCQTE